MNVTELKTLAGMAESLLARARGLQDHERVVAYNNLLHRIRRRVNEGLLDLSRRREVEIEITGELWLMAKELPGTRRNAEVAAQSVRPGSGDRAARIGRPGVRDGA